METLLTTRDIVERFDQRFERLSAKFLQTEYGYDAFTLRSETGKRCLPYRCDGTLAKVRNAGRWLAMKPTIIAASQKLISYVIAAGHTYRFEPRTLAIGNRRLLKQQERAAEQLTRRLALELERLFWYGIQEETYSRLLRDGEVFRRIWDTPLGIDLTFIEPELFLNPTSFDRIINFSEVPLDVVVRIRHANRIVGTLGIVDDGQDVRKAIGYWQKVPHGHSDGGDGWLWVDGDKIQHLKDGVDSNDPRGVPRFYWALCHVVGIDEINGAMIDLALVQAEHAAVYNFDQNTFISDIDKIAHNRQIRQDENEGRPLPPGVTHAKGFRIEIPGMDIAAKDNIEVVQQQQRFIGNLTDLPEFMVTSDANTGNRSSLVAAEGPFDRRVQREQHRAFQYDQAILWRMVETLGTSEELRMTYRIRADFPIAHSRDRAKDVQSELGLVAAKLKSRRQARATLNINHIQAELDLDEQTPDSKTVDATSSG